MDQQDRRPFSGFVIKYFSIFPVVEFSGVIFQKILHGTGYADEFIDSIYGHAG